MLNIIVLAAGQGKRMRSARPKVLQILAGRYLLAHVLATARQLHPARLVVVCGHGAELVRQAFPEPDLLWADQDQPLGTGHAVLSGLTLLDPAWPTLVLYGDVPLIGAATLRQLLLAGKDGSLALLTAWREDPRGYGRIVRTQGHIRRIVEEKDAMEAERAIREVNTGILVAPTSALVRWLPALSNANAQGEYYLTDIVALAAAENHPIVSTHPEHLWEIEGVNDKAQLAQLERIFQRQQAAALLANGVTLLDPARFDLRGELVCGQDVTIDVGCVFEGRVELADGVSVGPHCVLKNVTVASGTRIEAFCHLDGARIGPDCRIGPYARLRPGSDLAGKVHLGNFVEVKNSQIGEGSKANHLSYLGDATIGRAVNVGAGVITCNYDGAHKHRTVIEDDAFIGSDCQLVAPVTVGSSATLGAGTTLTRDAPAGQLTLSRPKQVSLTGWRRPGK